jgi:putative glutamine amidotransferase
MKMIAVTQRVAVVPGYLERRDCLDQAWARFLRACDLLPLLLPNIPETAIDLVGRIELAGLLLTGGNDLVPLGGDAPERDATEFAVLAQAEHRKMPVMGVCRGMQVLQCRHGVALKRVEGHVTASQMITMHGRRAEVNSYHRFGSAETAPLPLETWAVADDGVHKAVRDISRPIVGVMWHPERYSAPREQDVELFRSHFGVTT